MAISQAMMSGAYNKNSELQARGAAPTLLSLKVGEVLLIMVSALPPAKGANAA